METIRGVARAFLTPKNDHGKTQTNEKYSDDNGKDTIIQYFLLLPVQP